MDDRHERFLKAAREVQDERGFAEAKDIMDHLGMDISASGDRAAYREIMPSLQRLGYVDCQASDDTGLPCGVVKILT